MPIYNVHWYKLVAMLWFSLLGLFIQEYVGAGIQLIRFTSEIPETLLVQNHLTKKWSFPKSQRKVSDLSYYETAIRSVYEETGYRLYEDYTLCDRGLTVWGKRPYWTGLMVTNKTPRLHTIAWFNLTKKLLDLSCIKDVEEWKKDGMRIYCD